MSNFIVVSNVSQFSHLLYKLSFYLCSFSGKFGQRSNLIQTKYITKLAEYLDIMISDSQIIKTNVRFVSKEMVHMDWTYLDDFVEVSGRTNVVLVAYTTAQARLNLYEYLKNLNTRALYYDTDSMIFTNSKIVLIVDLSLYLKTKKLLSVFPLFMTNMLSFLRTRLPTISCLYVNHITSNA